MEQSTQLRAPEYLQDEALLEWERVTAELAKAGKLDPKLRPLLVMYCQSWAIAQAAHRYVLMRGAVVRNHGTAQASPFYKVYREETTTCEKLLHSLGMVADKTPAKVEEEQL